MAAKAAFLTLALPIALLAQAPAGDSCPPAVDQELRARVSQFLQFHVDGSFASYRKAMDMVAEDTQEEYFIAGKMKLKGFELNSLKFNSDCSKAVVTSTVKRDWQIQMQDHEVVVPMVTNWKIENGKWMWYHDLKESWLTPMGPSKIEPPTKNPDGTVNIPKNLGAEVIAAAAKAIMTRSAVDKQQVIIDPARAYQGQVTFTNGIQGVVVVSLAGVPEIAGFRATLEKKEVGAGDQAKLLLSYEPRPGGAVPESFMLRIVTEPLNQTYPVTVTFRGPDGQ